MEKPKYRLKWLRPENKDSKEIISLIAGGTGALEKITLIRPEHTHGLFNMLVERNKSFSCVQIGFDCGLPDLKKIDVMGTFLKPPELKKLVLGDNSGAKT